MGRPSLSFCSCGRIGQVAQNLTAIMFREFKKVQLEEFIDGSWEVFFFVSLERESLKFSFLDSLIFFISFLKTKEKRSLPQITKLDGYG